MTSIYEQFQTAPSLAADETSERLFWGAYDFPSAKSSNSALSEQRLQPEEPSLSEQPPLTNQFPQFQRFPQRFEFQAQDQPGQIILTDWRPGQSDGPGQNQDRVGLPLSLDTLDGRRRDLLYKKIDAFEKRAVSDGLTREQVAATFKQIRRIIDTPSDVLNEEQRFNIAEQVLAKAADPTSIDQGLHDTCGAAVIEVRSYLRHPEKAAELVANVALTGKVTTANGVDLPIDATPHDTSKLAVPKSGQRSHASELFQVASINLALNSRPDVVEGSLAYRQNDRRPETIDSGERVVDASVFPPKESRFQGLYVADVIRMNKLINNEDDPNLVLWHTDDPTGARYGRPFNSEADLQTALLDAKRNGKLPAVLYVYSGNEPLWQDAPNNADGGRGAWHFINVTDIKPGAPPQVEIDSTWSRNADHTAISGKPIKLADLYLATLEPKEAEDRLKQQVAANRAAGNFDTGKEVALARQQWVNKDISTESLEQSLRELLLLSSFRWKTESQAGKLNSAEKTESVNKLMEAVDRLPYDSKIRMLDSLKGNSIIDATEYNAALVATTNEMLEQRMMKRFAGELSPEDELGFKSARDEIAKRMREMSPGLRQEVEDQLHRGQNFDNSGFFASRAKERRERRKL